MKNKTQFATGIGMGIVEGLGLAFFYLSKLPTTKIVLYGMVLFVVLYNLLAAGLMLNGSRGK